MRNYKAKDPHVYMLETPKEDTSDYSQLVTEAVCSLRLSMNLILSFAWQFSKAIVPPA